MRGEDVLRKPTIREESERVREEGRVEEDERERRRRRRRG